MAAGVHTSVLDMISLITRWMIRLSLLVNPRTYPQPSLLV